MGEKKRITAEIKLKPHSQVSRAELSTHAPKNFKKTKNVTYNCRHTSSSRRIHSFVFVPVDQWLRRSLSNTCAAFWAGDSREIPFTLYERGFTLGSNSTSIICTVQSLSGFWRGFFQSMEIYVHSGFQLCEQKREELRLKTIWPPMDFAEGRKRMGVEIYLESSLFWEN